MVVETGRYVDTPCRSRSVHLLAVTLMSLRVPKIGGCWESSKSHCSGERREYFKEVVIGSVYLTPDVNSTHKESSDQALSNAIIETENPCRRSVLPKYLKTASSASVLGSKRLRYLSQR